MTSFLSRRQALAALAGVGTAAVLPGAAHACSRVFWNDNPVMLVGRTLDWSRHVDEAMWVPPAGMERSGRAPDNPAKWKSRYASLIIAGLDICTEEGINEKGLVVNLLYSGRGARPIRNRRSSHAAQSATRPGDTGRRGVKTAKLLRAGSGCGPNGNRDLAHALTRLVGVRPSNYDWQETRRRMGRSIDAASAQAGCRAGHASADLPVLQCRHQLARQGHRCGPENGRGSDRCSNAHRA